MFLQLSLVLLTAPLAFGSPINVKIVNGSDAAIGEFPFIVSVRFFDSHICGGTIVNERFVITAAHCVNGGLPFYFDIQYGVTRITYGVDAPNVILVSQLIIHEDYRSGNGYYNDIALLKLSVPLTFNSLVQPITLPKALSATPELTPAVLIGWGHERTGGQVQTHLQKVDIMVFSDDDCERLHSDTGPTNRDYHVCAGIPEGGKGQCNGDSGGPLLVNDVQIGIVSWSVKPCTIQGYPGVFTKSAKYVDWIEQNIRENSYS